MQNGGKWKERSYDSLVYTRNWCPSWIINITSKSEHELKKKSEHWNSAAGCELFVGPTQFTEKNGEMLLHYCTYIDQPEKIYSLKQLNRSISDSGWVKVWRGQTTHRIWTRKSFIFSMYNKYLDTPKGYIMGLYMFF